MAEDVGAMLSIIIQIEMLREHHIDNGIRKTVNLRQFRPIMPRIRAFISFILIITLIAIR